jgi:hypothetical protein
MEVEVEGKMRQGVAVKRVQLAVTLLVERLVVRGRGIGLVRGREVR